MIYENVSIELNLKYLYLIWRYKNKSNIKINRKKNKTDKNVGRHGASASSDCAKSLFAYSQRA